MSDDVKRAKLSELIQDPHNANKGTERGAEMVRQSITKLGAGRSILMDKNGVLIAGNKTQQAAIEAGLLDAIVVRTDGNQLVVVQRTDLDLSIDAKAKELAVVDNRSSEIGLEWDTEVLADLSHDVDLSDWFKDEELVDILTDMGDLEPLLNEEQDEETTADLIEKAEDGGIESRVKPGEIWQLGRHRIACGDSTDEGNVRKLLGDRFGDVGMVWADPPYNCADEMSESFYAGSNSPAMKKLSDADWDKGFDPFALFSILDKVRPKDGTVYICTSHMLAGMIWQWMSKESKLNGYCVWTKPNPMPSLAKRHWTWATELVCYATYGKHYFNFPDSGHALNWIEINKNSANRLHPTQKPIELVELFFERSSKPDDIIFDPFLGSAPSIIAAQKMGGTRTVYGFELSEVYCTVIIERWEHFTGQVAELAGHL